MITAAKPHLTLSGRCSECGRAQVRQTTDGRGGVIDAPDPCIHFRARRAVPPPQPEPRIPLKAPESEPKEEPVAAHATKNGDRKKIRALVLEQLQRNPTVTAAEVFAEVTRAFRVSFSMANFYATYWTPTRKQLGITGAGPAAAPRKTPEPPRQEKKQEAPAVAPKVAEKSDPGPVAVADVAFSEAVHGNGSAAAVVEENRSLRATYEAGEFVRIEEEEGVWSLRVSLDFQTRGDALNALTGLLGLVE